VTTTQHKKTKNTYKHASKEEIILYKKMAYKLTKCNGKEKKMYECYLK